MNELYLMSMNKQQASRETRRTQAEREHPDGLSRYEIWDAIGDSPTIRMRVQSIISNIRKPIPSAPSRRIQPKPISNCSPQV